MEFPEMPNDKLVNRLGIVDTHDISLLRSLDKGGINHDILVLTGGAGVMADVTGLLLVTP